MKLSTSLRRDGGMTRRRPELDQVEQRVAVARQPEEVVLLFHHVGPGQVLGTQALGRKLGGRVELLAADAVQAAIRLAVDIVVRRAGLPQLLRPSGVARVGARADELVVRQVQQRLQALEHRRVPLDKFPRGDAFGLGGLHVLQGILVAARQEVDVLAALPMIPREGVGLDDLQREADVRARVDVRDRRRHVVDARRQRLRPPGPLGAWSWGYPPRWQQNTAPSSARDEDAARGTTLIRPGPCGRGPLRPADAGCRPRPANGGHPARPTGAQDARWAGGSEVISPGSLRRRVSAGAALCRPPDPGYLSSSLPLAMRVPARPGAVPAIIPARCFRANPRRAEPGSVVRRRAGARAPASAEPGAFAAYDPLHFSPLLTIA